MSMFIISTTKKRSDRILPVTPFFVDAWMLLQDLNIDVSTVGIYIQFSTAAIDIT